MNSELRELIIAKCKSKGIAVEHLAQVAGCSIIELKGYSQGLFMLSNEKLARIIKALSIQNDELVAAIGDESAKKFVQCRISDLA